MKKFIIALSALLLALLVTGCSCNPPSQLSFSPNWKKSETVSAGYESTTTYDVKLNKSFILGDNNYSKTDKVDSVFEDYNFVGTYTETVSVIEVSDYNKDKSEILEDSKNATLLKINSLLELTATYKQIGKETVTYNDFVKTESYLLDTDNALAPIYTESENNYSVVNIANVNPIQTLHFKTTMLYTKNKMSCKKQEFKYGENVETAKPLSENVYTTDYSYKCLIDNTSLLFALRNLNYSKDKATYLPVVAPAYRASVDLTVSYADDIKINDALNLSWETKLINFVSSNTDKMGMPQLVFLQNKEVGGKNNSLKVKYVSPLAEYSSDYARLGALEYLLKTY